MVISVSKPQRVVITLVLSLDDYLLKKTIENPYSMAIPVGYGEWCCRPGAIFRVSTRLSLDVGLIGFGLGIKPNPRPTNPTSIYLSTMKRWFALYHSYRRCQV